MNSTLIRFGILSLALAVVVAYVLLVRNNIFRGAFDLLTSDSGPSTSLLSEENVMHSVPLEEIENVLLPDGIPPIDNPSFVSVQEGEEFLANEEPGVALSINGVDRFYPYQILVFHEIVNDTIDGQRVLVTYCPLCLTGIVFDPLVEGERVEFGTSGKLWQSNLVMYDRKTESLWSQVLGEAIVGPQTGTSLEILPSDRVLFGEWKEQFPEGQVLSKETGAFRRYGHDPYGDYYTKPEIFFQVSAEDTRLERKDFVLGIVIDNKAKAYHTEAVKRVGTVVGDFAGVTIIAEYDETLDVVRLFKQVGDTPQDRERINPIGGFWFSWVAAHPDTELFY